MTGTARARGGAMLSAGHCFSRHRLAAKQARPGLLRMVPVRKMLVVPLLLAGCGDTLPLALQNQSDEAMTVVHASRDGKCGAARPVRLAPSERLLVTCAAADLTSVTITMADGRKCALTQAEVAARVEERKGMRGSFLLPLKGC